jgi:hypothetical protein
MWCMMTWFCTCRTCDAIASMRNAWCAATMPLADSATPVPLCHVSRLEHRIVSKTRDQILTSRSD